MIGPVEYGGNREVRGRTRRGSPGSNLLKWFVFQLLTKRNESSKVKMARAKKLTVNDYVMVSRYQGLALLL